MGFLLVEHDLNFLFDECFLQDFFVFVSVKYMAKWIWTRKNQSIFQINLLSFFEIIDIIYQWGFFSPFSTHQVIGRWGKVRSFHWFYQINCFVIILLLTFFILFIFSFSYESIISPNKKSFHNLYLIFQFPTSCKLSFSHDTIFSQWKWFFTLSTTTTTCLLFFMEEEKKIRNNFRSISLLFMNRELWVKEKKFLPTILNLKERKRNIQTEKISFYCEKLCGFFSVMMTRRI